MLKLVKSTNPVLTRATEKVVFPSPDVARIASDMMQTMLVNHGCGLAAPQIGLSLKIFVWSDGIEQGVVINPVIVPVTDAHVVCKEGCLSFPNELYETRRAPAVLCTYYGIDGSRKVLEKIDGFRAIIWQHENDHLNGRLLPHHGTREV